MKSTLLASELRKVGFSERLAFADFLAFEDFLMFLGFLDLDKFSTVSSALPLPHHRYQPRTLSEPNRMIQSFLTLG